MRRGIFVQDTSIETKIRNEFYRFCQKQVLEFVKNGNFVISYSIKSEFLSYSDARGDTLQESHAKQYANPEIFSFPGLILIGKFNRLSSAFQFL
jgi:hypothetical protein